MKSGYFSPGGQSSRAVNSRPRRRSSDASLRAVTGSARQISLGSHGLGRSNHLSSRKGYLEPCTIDAHDLSPVLGNVRVRVVSTRLTTRFLNELVRDHRCKALPIDATEMGPCQAEVSRNNADRDLLGVGAGEV